MVQIFVTSLWTTTYLKALISFSWPSFMYEGSYCCRHINLSRLSMACRHSWMTNLIGDKFSYWFIKKMKQSDFDEKILSKTVQ